MMVVATKPFDEIFDITFFRVSLVVVDDYLGYTSFFSQMCCDHEVLL